jgi:predicted dehydrogenase
MKTVNVGIIGCGRVAGNHVKAIEKIPGLKLTAACDLIKERAEKLIAGGGIPAYNNYFDMLMRHPEIDLVSIITPSGMHFEHALDIIENFRKNVLIEKPVVLRLSHAKLLSDAAIRNKVEVFSVLQYRFNKCVQRVKRAINDGELGQVFLATVRLRWCRPQGYYDRDPWRGTFAMDGGACTNQGVHHLDLLRYLIGEVKRVNCRMHTFGAKVEVEDTVVAMLEFSQQAQGLVEITTAARPYDFESSISVLGTRGLAMIGGSSTGELIRFSPAPEDEKKYSEVFPNPYGYGHEEIYLGAYNCLVRQDRPAVEFEDAQKTLRLLHGLYLSDELSRWVDIETAQESVRLGCADENLAKIYRCQKPVGLKSAFRES